MKLNKYFLALVVFAGSLLTSCNQDNEGAIYRPYTQNVSFEVEEPGQVLANTSSVEVPVRLIRSDKSESYTAHYSLDVSEEGIFSTDGNGSVTFEPGQSIAVVTVKANNMQMGNEYECTLTLSEADIALADTILNNANYKTVVSVMCDYNWVSAGTCKFIDYTFSDGDSADGVAIENAEGTNLYRIVEPFISVYGKGADGFEKESGIEFYLNSDYSITYKVGAGDIVCTADGYSFVWLDKYVPDYCYSVNEGNYYEASFLGLVNGEGYYTGFAFGFEWTEGWPGN